MRAASEESAMSSPLSASTFLEALANEGLTVVQAGDWHTHNRNHKGPWGPVNGVMIHHTATRGTDATVRSRWTPCAPGSATG
jgi:hypothetical protein